MTSRAYSRLHSIKGFTLIEIMLVILLMGMTAAAVTLTYNTSSPKDKMARSAKQFIASVEMIQDETVLNGFLVGIVVEDNRYQFVLRKQGEWLPLEVERLLTKRNMDEGVTLLLDVEGLPFKQEDEDKTTFFEQPFEEADVGFEKEEPLPEPQILLFPTGEMTGFELVFLTKDDDHKDIEVKVIGDSLGRMQLKTANESTS